ncbi:MAG: hypothetical protein LQ343_003774 [Gyalolechia ehrenbergii]|nr:MAG: hypothetical protein LQ343_003774 [Gyalolechia ehrenbergii]
MTKASRNSHFTVSAISDIGQQIQSLAVFQKSKSSPASETYILSRGGYFAGKVTPSQDAIIALPSDSSSPALATAHEPTSIFAFGRYNSKEVWKTEGGSLYIRGSPATSMKGRLKAIAMLQGAFQPSFDGTCDPMVVARDGTGALGSSTLMDLLVELPHAHTSPHENAMSAITF